MDNAILNLMAAAVSRQVARSRITGVAAAREGIELRLTSGPLFFCLRQDLPLLLARAQGEARRSRFTHLASRLRQKITDAEVFTLEKKPADRIVSFSLSGGDADGFSLVFHAIPRRTNLYLLNRDMKIAAGVSAEEGARYEAPVPAPAEHDLYTASEQELALFFEHASKAEKPATAIKAGLLGVDRILASEIAERLAQGTEAAVDFAGKLRSLNFKAAIFQAVPGDDSGLNLLPDIYEAKTAEKLEVFADPDDAAETFLRRRLRAEAVNTTTSEINLALNNRRRKIIRLKENLERDIVSSEKDSRLGTFGDLLLANLRSIRKGDTTARVEDIFQGDGSLVAIPLNPALDPTANADEYYRRARKAKRTVNAVRGRIGVLASETEQLEEFQGRLAAAGDDLKQLRKLHKETVERGWITQRQRKEMKVEGHSRPGFVSSDGLEIIVGRNSADNEVVTFQLARDNDFWFHTAGYPGSHVVVRNLMRLKQPPPATMGEAAAIAAYFSRARQSSNVQVHWTQRRFVKKIKGGSAGKVVLKSYSSTVANPSIPSTVRQG
jgi:predicted ribosome quality control (RQC) complex YloA/Tae2 family protein